MKTSLKSLINIPYEFSHAAFLENKEEIENKVKNTKPQWEYLYNQSFNSLTVESSPIFFTDYIPSTGKPIAISKIKTVLDKKPQNYSKYLHSISSIAILPQVVSKKSFLAESQGMTLLMIQSLINVLSKNSRIFLKNKDSLSFLQGMYKKISSLKNVQLSDEEFDHMFICLSSILETEFESPEKNKIKQILEYYIKKIKDSRDLFYLFFINDIFFHITESRHAYLIVEEL